MALFVAGLLVLLYMAGRRSDAAYCVCSTGGDAAFQKNIDYACGTGADCAPILQNGACFNPNTVKDHCNYAVNSYYQRKGQVSGSCDFSGTATVSQTIPSAPSGCVYQSSPSNGGGTSVPSTNPNISGTPNPGSTTSPGGSTTSPGGSTTSPGGASTGGGTAAGGGTVIGGTMPMTPTAFGPSTFSNPDGSGAGTTLPSLGTTTFGLLSFLLALSLMHARI